MHAYIMYIIYIVYIIYIYIYTTFVYISNVLYIHLSVDEPLRWIT